MFYLFWLEAFKCSQSCKNVNSVVFWSFYLEFYLNKVEKKTLITLKKALPCA